MNTGFIFLNSPTIGGIGYLVKAIVGITSSIALGVVLFTIILKLVTLPFDFMSRRSMRKNSLLMEKMRPELEKLQPLSGRSVPPCLSERCDRPQTGET